MCQIKKQEKSAGKEQKEMEASNLTDTEFKVMIIRMLNSMKKDIETIKKGQSEIKKAISEINNTLEGINSKLDETKNRISVLEDKVEKNI